VGWKTERGEKDNPSLAPVGRDFLPLLTSTKQGLVNPDQAFVSAGHERHTLTRDNDFGYPNYPPPKKP
jgi:hypothetical protein